MRALTQRKSRCGSVLFLRPDAMASAKRAFKAYTGCARPLCHVVNDTVLGLEWAFFDPTFDGRLYETAHGAAVADTEVASWDGDYTSVRVRPEEDRTRHAAVLGTWNTLRDLPVT